MAAARQARGAERRRARGLRPGRRGARALRAVGTPADAASRGTSAPTAMNGGAAHEHAHADTPIACRSAAQRRRTRRPPRVARAMHARRCCRSCVAAALLGAWSATAPLAGAVIAPAQRQGRAEPQDRAAPGRRHRARDPGARRRSRCAPAIRCSSSATCATTPSCGLLQDQLRARAACAARAPRPKPRSQPRFEVPAEPAATPPRPEHVARERALFDARRRALDEQARVAAGADRARRRRRSRRSVADRRPPARPASCRDEELAINESLARQGFVSARG